MNINCISNSISTSFKGILLLNKGVVVNGPGFPKDCDLVDIFEYSPFSDDSDADIENDKIKMQQLTSYLETTKLESDRYSVKQVGANIYLTNKLDCSKSEYSQKSIDSSIKKKLLNLSEISAEDIISKVLEIKKNLMKAQPCRTENNSILFKYM